MVKIAPSVLSCDFSRLEDDVRAVVAAGADWLHLDIMDGHFVPNISFGPGIAGHFDRATDTFLDVHLMLTDPARYVDAFIKNGADSITFHIEAVPEPAGLISHIHNAGIKAGLTLNPDTPLERIFMHLAEVDLLLIMSVFPGFGGQKYIPESTERIRRSRRFIDENGFACLIEVDGGVNLDTCREVVEAGADVLVAGSAVFGSRNYAETIKALRCE